MLIPLEKCGQFSNFQYGFRPSQSTASLLTVVSDSIARAFINRSGDTWDVTLDIPKAFDRVCDAGLLYKLKSYEISGLFKNIQLIMEFLMAPFLAWHFSYHTFMTFLMLFSVKLLSVLMILLSILSVIRHLVCGNN